MNARHLTQLMNSCATLHKADGDSEMEEDIKDNVVRFIRITAQVEVGRGKWD